MAAVFFRALYRSIMRALHKIRVKTSSGGCLETIFFGDQCTTKNVFWGEIIIMDFVFWPQELLSFVPIWLKWLLKVFALRWSIVVSGPPGICNYKTPSKLLFSLVVWIGIGVVSNSSVIDSFPSHHTPHIAPYKRYLYLIMIQVLT